MRQGLALAAVVVALAVSIVTAQNTVDYLNGVPYVWPSTQAAADHILTNDGTGTLTWADPPSAEGLWSGVIVASTVDCPASGWTRVSAGDGSLLIGNATPGATGGSATHTHALSGLTASAAVTISGDTGGSGTVGLNGSTATTSISHYHGSSFAWTTVGDTPYAYTVLSSVNGVNSYNPSHSHSVGTLTHGAHYHSAGGLNATAHGHGTGTLAAGEEPNLPAYVEVVLCQRN